MSTKYELVEIDDSYPQYIKDHIDELTAKGFIKPLNTREGFTHTEAEVAKAVETINRHTPKQPTVTASVSTKDRYTTTLPMCLSAIITQTRKPDKLVIYDDGELTPEELAEKSPFKGLFAMCSERGIPWEVFDTPKMGQVANHQHALDNATTDFIWRVDDDEVAMPDCLHHLLSTISVDETIGAVGGLVLPPGEPNEFPPWIDGSLSDIQAGLNLAWYRQNGGPRKVQHLYSTFIYRTEAARKVGGYPRNLSVVGHREESIFTHLMHRAGYMLLLNPTAVTHHLREATGGIRSFNDTSLWEHDEQVWQSYLSEWGVGQAKPTKLIVADMGRGDHYLLLSILSELQQRHKDKELILALCFPEVFEGQDVKIISIADAKVILGERYEDALLYKALWERDWKQPIVDGMREFWG